MKRMRKENELNRNKKAENENEIIGLLNASTLGVNR